MKFTKQQIMQKLQTIPAAILMTTVLLGVIECGLIYVIWGKVFESKVAAAIAFLPLAAVSMFLLGLFAGIAAEITSKEKI